MPHNLSFLIQLCTTAIILQTQNIFGKIVLNCDNLRYNEYRDLSHKASHDIYTFVRDPSPVILAMNTALLEGLRSDRLRKLSILVDDDFEVEKYMDIIEDSMKGTPLSTKTYSINELAVSVVVQSKIDITPILKFII